MTLLVVWLLAAEPVVSTVHCQTVADCWLDADGQPVARPKASKGKPLPHGDCGRNLHWLRHKLTCEQNVCVSQFRGDRC